MREEEDQYGRVYYAYRDENECGLIYRPRELSGTEYCHLKRDHPGLTHSTRIHPMDLAGFDWTERPSDLDASFWPGWD